jgi:hypothetical protein
MTEDERFNKLYDSIERLGERTDMRETRLNGIFDRLDACILKSRGRQAEESVQVAGAGVGNVDSEKSLLVAQQLPRKNAN